MAMKRNPPQVPVATSCLFATWFSAICLAASLIIISASAAASPPSTEKLSAAEKWVVAQVTAGKTADLSKQFPEEKDRKLSTQFLQSLLTGAPLHRHGVRINWAIIDEPIELENAQIPSEVRLLDCRFNARVTFISARFAGNVSFRESTFEADATFSSMKVSNSAYFIDAAFKGPVTFDRADIEGNLVAQSAKFPSLMTFFNDVKVGGQALFDGAVFKGGVIFRGANIASNFEAAGAKFESKRNVTIFDNMKVGGYASFRGAEFQGRMVFMGADIAGNLDAERTLFQNEQQQTYFNGMKVRGNALFNGAIFKGPVTFNRADIAGDLEVQATFQKGAAFNGTKVGGNAVFIARFEGPVTFNGADIAGDFQANGGKFQNANFRGMKVRGDASINAAVFEGPVDLRYAEFGSLDVSGASWPQEPSQLLVEGMSYQTILAQEPKSHKRLVDLADHSAYTADMYRNLEEFFLRKGYRGDADEAFIAGKVRERKEYFLSGDWFRWLRSWMLYLLADYGRHPWQAGIPCAVLIGLGCILFSPKKMEPQNPNETPRVYSRFWYSLNLFLPVVDLQAGKVWKPKADQTFLRNYMRVHILLGWILIPLVLAAVTGLIK
jgi:uncharacterized protein YjbI with pentapeptide repeats